MDCITYDVQGVAKKGDIIDISNSDGNDGKYIVTGINSTTNLTIRKLRWYDRLYHILRYIWIFLRSIWFFINPRIFTG